MERDPDTSIEISRTPRGMTLDSTMKDVRRRERKRTRFSVTETEFEGKRYFFTTIGRGRYLQPGPMIIVHPELVMIEDEKKYIEFPLNGDVTEIEKGAVYLITPTPEKTTYYVYVECGFRGMSIIRVISPQDAKVFEFWDYKSELGSIGKSMWVLITVDRNETVKIEWERTGRTYGESREGIMILYPDGTIEEIKRLNTEKLKIINELLNGE
jgi:hypothetical protein